VLQTLGMYHSFRKSKQLGPITRLLSCTEEQLKHYEDVEGVPTHIAPSWAIHPVTGDNYRFAHLIPPAALGKSCSLRPGCDTHFGHEKQT